MAKTLPYVPYLSVSERSARRGLAPIFGWLDGRGFDSVFLLGGTGLALTAGLVVALDGGLFKLLLALDLWLLGYHHVIATFTRVAFEGEGAKRHRWLFTVAPFGVLAAVLALAAFLGPWSLVTVYLYWQWWHYTRQSYGVAQLYRLKAAQPQLSLREMQAAIYLLPLTGILYRSYQQPANFLSAELWVLPVPFEAVAVAGCMTAGFLLYFVARAWQSWRSGTLAGAYHLYLLTHLTIFGIGYLAFNSISHGWIVINIWHNTQYLLIVWLFNNKRFKNQVDPSQRLASTLSLRSNLPRYFAMTLGATALIYVGLNLSLSLFAISALPVALVAYQTINFHHYIVDSFIWKIRRPQVAANLGLAPQQPQA